MCAVIVRIASDGTKGVENRLIFNISKKFVPDPEGAFCAFGVGSPHQEL
jgi:hypothetical protein